MSSPARRLRWLSGLRLATGAAVLSFALASTLPAQQGGQARITPNFKDADITQIAEAVSAATGKNFIIDPRVRAQVTMLSSTPMSPAAFYEAFLAILSVHGFVAVPSGDIIKILPDANARQMPGKDLPDRVSATSDEIVTQVISVRNVNAAQLVPILRPLIPQQGHLAAYPAGNILIISDRANNVSRIMRIVKRIDSEGDSDAPEVIPLQNASAAEVVRVFTSLNQGQAAANAEGGGSAIKLVADERSNSVIIAGEPSQRLRVKALIAHLDTPLESGGDTQVRYLRYADAAKIAPKLKEQVTGIAQATPGGAQGTPAAQSVDKSTTIWADAQTNSLVITAPPKVMRQLMAIVDKLDIRRAQVLVEAIIVEVSEDKSAELGVNWAVWSSDKNNTNVPGGLFNQPIGGTASNGIGIVDLARGIQNPSAITTAPVGTTLGIGRVQPTGVNFAAMIRALRGDGKSNVLSTPSAVTMDNQEAQLKVAQEVPFVTGQYTNTGTTTNGAVNPFQTIQRQEVGTILKVTPQINEGDAVMLKIELESSSLAASSRGAVDLITNKRTINTNVLIEDGGVVVLGGLISDQATKGEQRVPFLGRIPILGLAFKTRSGTANKTNLMVFIRPKILRDGVATAIETNSKYNYIRGEQARQMTPEVLPLLPRSNAATLPPLTPEQKARETAPPPAEPVKGVDPVRETKAPATAPANPSATAPANPPTPAPQGAPPAAAPAPARPASGARP